MKKILLSVVAVFAAMSVNAQVFKVSAEANGIGSDAVDVEAGKAWGSIEGVIDVSNPFATQHKSVDCKNNGFNKVIIDGNEIETKDGVQGQDNPKDADGGNPALTLKEAVSGAVIQIDAKKNGWVYIVAKLSTNKQYVVFEEGAAMGYKIAMENTDERIANGVLNLEIKGEGEYNYIPEGRQIQWVIKEFLNDEEAASAGNGLGVIYFPVAEGCKYYAHATGSKISWSGIYFSENEAAKVEVVGETEEGAISKVLVGGAPVDEKVYSVIGTIEGNWDSDKDMTKGSDGIYTAVFENVKAGNYEFKIRVNHDWAENFGVDGAQDGPNLTVSVPTDGSTITIKFNLSTKTITATVSVASGISTIKNDINANDVIFNAAGQKVGANYKGLVIKNGKKMIQ
jgi:hypothetical protein